MTTIQKNINSDRKFHFCDLAIASYIYIYIYISVWISITVAVNANSKRFFTQFWRTACEFRSRMAFRVTKTLKILSRHLYPLYSWPAFVPAFPLYFIPFFFSFLLLFFFAIFLSSFFSSRSTLIMPRKIQALPLRS